MSKDNTTSSKPVEKRGGYGAGNKLVSELKPPPSGPAPGASSSEDSGKNKH